MVPYGSRRPLIRSPKRSFDLPTGRAVGEEEVEVNIQRVAIRSVLVSTHSIRPALTGTNRRPFAITPPGTYRASGNRNRRIHMPGSVIVGGARTPIGKLSGALK